MKLTYQDALELKEAGFPQEGKGGYLPTFPTKEEQAYVPTLEELIERCGEELHGIRKILDESSDWFAYSSNRNVVGSSPIQAVKNLYCALHK